MQYKNGEDADLSVIEAVSAGKNHMGIADKDGFVYSCGNNASGELGLGDNKSRIIFTRIGNMDIMVDNMYIPVRNIKRCNNTSRSYI